MSRTIEQCAEIVSLSVATMKEYVKRGMPVEKDGTFDVTKVVEWIAENGKSHHLIKDKKKKPAARRKAVTMTPAPVAPRAPEPPPKPENDLPMTMQEAKTRKEIANALQAELNLAKEMEQVANIDDLMDEFREALITVRASLSSMSSRLAGILAHQEEHDIRKIIEKEVATMLTGLSKYENK